MEAVLSSEMSVTSTRLHGITTQIFIFIVITMRIPDPTNNIKIVVCSLVDMYKHFGGTCYLHPQGRNNTFDFPEA
jgi:hypothetical protein